MTPETQQKAAAFAALQRRPASGPEDRSLSERCIVGFTNGTPFESRAYNQNLQIFQTRDYVVVLNEMIHDARIIPLDGRPHLPPAIRHWSGDSRGRWDGDTLVVDTTNFVDRTHTTVIGSARGASDAMHLVERFTRTAPDTLLYEYRVEDPGTYTRPYSVELPMTLSDDRIYEYACHEGNRGMFGILAGARSDEQAAGLER
jgi:hypothetical protein